MSETNFCEHCGASLLPTRFFVKTCGNPVAAPRSERGASFAAPLAAPPADRTASSESRLDCRLGNRGGTCRARLSCDRRVGYWFTQSKPPCSSQLPVGTPQVAIVALPLCQPMEHARQRHHQHNRRLLQRGFNQPVPRCRLHYQNHHQFL